MLSDVVENRLLQGFRALALALALEEEESLVNTGKQGRKTWHRPHSDWSRCGLIEKEQQCIVQRANISLPDATDQSRDGWTNAVKRSGNVTLK